MCVPEPPPQKKIAKCHMIKKNPKQQQQKTKTHMTHFETCGYRKRMQKCDGNMVLIYIQNWAITWF